MFLCVGNLPSYDRREKFAQAEKIIAEEEAGFRAGRSTTKQIFNLRILCEKYLPHKQDLYHVFLENIVTDSLEDHEGTVSIGGRTITNLRFADDIDGLAGEEEELAKLNECLDTEEISAEKTKLMTNNTSGINTEIKVNGQRLETVTSFKYLGSVITDEGSKPEILSMIAQTTAALTRLKPVWHDRSISLSSKI